jgi:hypothetical protein
MDRAWSARNEPVSAPSALEEGFRPRERRSKGKVDDAMCLRQEDASTTVLWFEPSRAEPSRCAPRVRRSHLQSTCMAERSASGEIKIAGRPSQRSGVDVM